MKERQVKRERMLAVIQTLRERDALLAGFDEPLWRATVEQMTVYSEKDVAVKFRDGREIHVDVRLKKCNG